MKRIRQDPAHDKEVVVVTGMGAIAAAGDSPDALWESATGGQSPAVWFKAADVPERSPIPACVVPRLPPSVPSVRRADQMDRSVQLALAAAGQAIADAGVKERLHDPTRLGVMVGTSRGPIQKWMEMVDLLKQGRRRLPPSLALHSSLACLSGALAMAFEAKGPCLTVSATCASGGHAIGLAAQQIAHGVADVMLAGGAEAPLQGPLIQQLGSTGILGSHPDPRQACRPFDTSRNGTVLGEGAAFLVLESLSSARRHDTRIYAQLSGWGASTDPFHCTAPPEDGDGLLRVMMQALALSGLQPEHIDYINMHGTGTRLNDRLEAVALRRLLGKRLKAVPCSSTKPVTGHCLGASAALEAVIGIRALQSQRIPPTANCLDLDPDFGMDVVPGTARSVPLQVVMSNSLGFWGNNASLIFCSPPN